MTPKRPAEGRGWRRTRRPTMNARDIPGTIVLEEWETPDGEFYVSSAVEKVADDAPEHHHLVMSRPRGGMSQAMIDRILAEFDARDLVPFQLPGSNTRHYFTKGVL